MKGIICHFLKSFLLILWMWGNEPHLFSTSLSRKIDIHPVGFKKLLIHLKKKVKYGIPE